MNKVTEYYTCGSMEEVEGLTFHHREYFISDAGLRINLAGNPNKGYKETVVTKAVFDSLLANTTAKGLYGVVNSVGSGKLKQASATAETQRHSKFAVKHRVSIKLAAKEALDIGESPEAVFSLRHPQLAKELIAKAFKTKKP